MTRIRVDLTDDLARLDAFEGSAPAFGFQSLPWLRSWYACFSDDGQRPLLATMTREGSDAPSLLVPLIRRRRYGLPLIEFADRGVTDYNMPVLGPGMPFAPREVADAMTALVRRTRPFAALRLFKMPAIADGWRNPLVTRGVAASSLQAHVLPLSAERGAFEAGLSAKKRKEVRRERRRIEEVGAFDFAEATSVQDREALYALIQGSQTRRMPGKDEEFLLEGDAYASFYDRLVRAPEMRGLSRLFGLWMNGKPIAAILCVQASPTRIIGLRIGQTEDEALVRYGPGRHLVLEMANRLGGDGIATLDLSVGGSTLKAWLHAEPVPLHERVLWASGYGQRLEPKTRAPYSHSMVPGGLDVTS